MGDSGEVQSDEFVAGAAQRLQAGGAAVTWQTLAGGPVIVGYQARFRLRWMATKLHLFTFVAAGPSVDARSLEQFANDALDFAVRAKGRPGALQVGVAAIPILAAATVDSTAIEFAQNRLIRRWSAFAWPCVFDLGTGRSYVHEGRVTVGGLYANWMRSQIAIALGLD
jgi:hypothetical protein